MSKGKDKSQVRCVIYTRKSTDENLDLDFNSLDAQREAGEAYIRSQQHEGWVCLDERYDDGGFTGGNMERPAFQRLMADVEAGKLDCIVVYKIDRLSRSLMDFARIMEKLEANGVSVVSVTQQFNTTTSMGRLTLNILLSFAQFEREIRPGSAPVIDTSDGRVPRIARLMALAIKFDRLIAEGAVRDQAHLAELGHVPEAPGLASGQPGVFVGALTPPCQGAVAARIDANGK